MLDLKYLRLTDPADSARHNCSCIWYFYTSKPTKLNEIGWKVQPLGSKLGGANMISYLRGATRRPMWSISSLLAGHATTREAYVRTTLSKIEATPVEE